MKKVRETPAQKRPPVAPPAEGGAGSASKKAKNFLDTKKKFAQQLQGWKNKAVETKAGWPKKATRGRFSKVLKGPPQVITDDDQVPAKGKTKEQESSSLMDEGRRLKKKYRKAAEMPDPSQAPQAEVNRTKQQVKLRLRPGLIESLDKAANDEGCPRNTLIETILERHFKPF